MGFFGTATKSHAASTGLLDRLCRELNWTIDDRHGNVIILNFNGDGITPQRSLIVGYAEGERTMHFSYHPSATFSRHSPPMELLAALLVRNNDATLCSWTAVSDGNSLSLKLKSGVLASGVDSAGFSLICQFMLKEAAEVESTLRQKGYM